MERLSTMRRIRSPANSKRIAECGVQVSTPRRRITTTSQFDFHCGFSNFGLDTYWSTVVLLRSQQTIQLRFLVGRFREAWWASHFGHRLLVAVAGRLLHLTQTPAFTSRS